MCSEFCQVVRLGSVGCLDFFCTLLIFLSETFLQPDYIPYILVYKEQTHPTHTMQVAEAYVQPLTVFKILMCPW